MEFTLQDKANEVISLILQSEYNANTIEHQNILSKLFELESQKFSYCDFLFNILCNYAIFIRNMEIDKQRQILIYIKNFLSKIYTLPDIRNIPNIRETLLTIIKVYFQKDNISLNIKPIYDKILQFIFEIIKTLNDAKNYLNRIFKEIIEVYLNQENCIDKIELIKICKIMEYYVEGYELFLIEQKENNIICECYSHILNKCEKTQIKNNYVDSLLFNSVIISFNKSFVQITDSLAKTHLFSYQYINNNNNPIESNFLENEKFLNFILHSLMLCYNSKDQTISNKQFLLFIYGNLIPEEYNNEHNFELAKFKGTLLELITYILYKFKGLNVLYELVQFKKFISILTDLLLTHLFNFYNSGNYVRENADNNEKEQSVISLVNKSLNLILEIMDCSYSNEIIPKFRFDILLYIIIPNVLTPPLEESFFTLDPENYLKFTLDASHLCEFEYPKQKSIKLLMTLCENIDGFFNYIIQLYIKIINTITKVKDTGAVSDDDNIYQFLIKNMNEKQLMSQSIEVLTYVSFLFDEREQMCDYFESNIDMINHLLIKIDDNFIKTKLCILYVYNLDHSFHDEQQVLSKSFHDALEFIFQCILLNNGNISLFMTGLNAINSIIFDESLRNFCIQIVKIYASKVIDYIQTNKLPIYEKDFIFYVKGIIKYYLSELKISESELFNFFWGDFEKSIKLSLTLCSQKRENKKLVEVSDNINLIHCFLKAIKNKDKDIKNDIYIKILSLTNTLSSFFYWEFEKEILDIINIIVTDIKMLPEEYAGNLHKYLSEIKSKDTIVIQDYNIDFIFNFIMSFRVEIINKFSFCKIIYEIISSHLLPIQRKTSVNTIISTHYTYLDFLNAYIMLFFPYLTKENIIQIANLLLKRMDTPPNADLNLNIKICLGIFLLIIKNNSFDFLYNNINPITFWFKVFNFFPLRNLSIYEHEIISLIFTTLAKDTITNNSNMMLGNKQIEIFIFNIIKINLDELLYIKKQSIKEEDNKKKKEQKESKEEFEFEIEFEKRKRTFQFTKRKNHLSAKVLNDIKESFDMSYDDEESSEEDIDSEKGIDEDEENDYQYHQEENDDYSDEIDYYDDENDKDEEFIRVKDKTMLVFKEHYVKYACQEVKDFIEGLNLFQQFDIMLKELKIANEQCYMRIINHFSKERINMIERFRKYKKIKVDNTNIYRKIIKIKK